MMKEDVKTKVCLIGDAGVGKTSLIKRYVDNTFSEEYIATVGTNVSTKEFVVDSLVPDVSFRLLMNIWDIMGQKGYKTQTRTQSNLKDKSQQKYEQDLFLSQ